MALELHFVCPHGLNHVHKREEEQFESGNWVVSNNLADEALGGRIFLHETQSSPAWHGGKVVGWRDSAKEGRKVFTYVVDGPFRFVCRENWAQEKSVVRKP
ncbi:MAG: hypothetical protein EOR01_30620 [Mesorhizobium sp.]|uniref:hypothetical protein n=1 Tax=Mesorhizobium sp. TaxID=1871066 RepID=UPI000FE472C0|nr:hypothetical protein [Mesorhizobium sp.]RWP14866.1 MAG: hypothetical protein EOR01_30620 [Mesorhizobium sp.]